MFVPLMHLYHAQFPLWAVSNHSSSSVKILFHFHIIKIEPHKIISCAGAQRVRVCVSVKKSYKRKQVRLFSIGSMHHIFSYIQYLLLSWNTVSYVWARGFWYKNINAHCIWIKSQKEHHFCEAFPVNTIFSSAK